MKGILYAPYWLQELASQLMKKRLRINKQLNEITKLKNLINSLTSKLSTYLKNLGAQNKWTGKQVLQYTSLESDEDNGLSENNSAPYAVASSEQPSNDKSQTL